jgi:hypothetical protein
MVSKGNSMAAQSSLFTLPTAMPKWRPAIQRAESASLDYRGWLKRIALVGWLIYAVGVILLPFWDEAKERNQALERASVSYEACKSVAAERGLSETLSECDNVYRARMDRNDEIYHFGSEYRSMGWHVAWVVPAAVFAPPLLFFVFVYGLIFVGRKTVNWLGKAVRE